MTGTAEIPGGVSEHVRLAGGDELLLQLQTILAGNATDKVLFALTSGLISLTLQVGGDTLDEAKAFVDVIANDVKNGLDLNWAENHVRAVAAGNALATTDGARRRQ